jgi:hypothetical protein
MRGQLGAGVALATFLTRVVTGAAGAMFPPLTAEVYLDGKPLPPAAYFGMLVSTMDRQFLDLQPYWGTEPGPLRFTELSIAPRHVMRGLISVIRGRPNQFMTVQNGYRSCNADRVELELDSGFTLDGELFAAGPGGRVALSGDRTAFFLRRPRRKGA